MASCNGIVGQSSAHVSARVPYRPRWPDETDPRGSIRHIPRPTTLPAFVRIVDFYIARYDENANGAKQFLSNSVIFHEVTFADKHPIIGSGHHFVVSAVRFADDEKSLLTSR